MTLSATRTTQGFEPIKHLYGHPIVPRLYRLTPNTAFVQGDMVILTEGMVAKAAANATAVLGVMAKSYTTSDNPTGGETYGLVIDDPAVVYRCSFTDHIDSTCTGGTTTTAVDTSLSTSTDDAWNGAAWYAYEGANAGTFRLVKDYTGTSDTLTFEKAFPVACDTTTKYIMLGVGTDALNIHQGQIGVDLKDENTIDANATTTGEAGPLAVYELTAEHMKNLWMDVVIRKHRYNGY